VTFHEEMEAFLATGAPNVDNVTDPDVIGAYGVEYDGPRCADDDCDTAVDNDGEMCEPCGDQPHEFRQHGDRTGWCACGRINAIGGYSPVHTDRGGGAA
jgi:hypothetical protein